jgi:hypothetical protein
MYYGLALKYLHTEVLKMLGVASTYNGNAFGRYVRDVITKIRCNDFSVTKVKYVDIWFKYSDDMRQFITNYNLLIPVNGDKIIKKNDGFGAIQYVLRDMFGDNIVYVDIIVSSVLPVWDLSVNFLLYDFSTNSLKCMNDYGLTKTLADIHNNRAILTNNGLSVLTNHNTDFTISDQIVKVNSTTFAFRIEKFIRDGWTIQTNKGRKIIIKDGQIIIIDI